MKVPGEAVKRGTAKRIRRRGGEAGDGEEDQAAQQM